LTSPRSLDAFAEWIRGKADARLLLVVRGEDVAFAVDAAIAPKDAVTMVEVAMPEIHAKLAQQRALARTQAEIARGFDG